MRYAIYIMIGFGAAMGMEAKGNDLSYLGRVVIIGTWPVVASYAYFKAYAKEPSHERG